MGIWPQGYFGGEFVKNILCKLGLHKRRKEYFIENVNWRNKQITSRSAYCERCGKKLFRVDKYGEER